MKILVCLLVVVLMLPSSARCDVCYYKATGQRRTTYDCGWPWWSMCTRYYTVYYTASKCCAGWTGESCNTPLCNGLTNGCSLREGRVQLRDGTVIRNSGGRCIRPNVCANCNYGYYARGSYCRVCPKISNCLYTHCTTSSNSVCKYCEGEVKEQYGWYAYTRSYPGDNMKKCRRACSWRSGSRCYPGTCSDETTSSCRCIAGVTGSDCNKITEDPYILQNFLRLTDITDTSANRVESPANSSIGAPQDTTWSSNIRLQQFSAHVDANYQKDLPKPPEDFYVNLEQTKIGIINGGLSLQWVRGSAEVAGIIREECVTEPMPNNYRCQLNGKFIDHNWHGPFQHEDILRFTVFARNGGYVSVYNRESNNRIVRYTVSGRTKTNVFEVGFDTEKPEHCVMKNLTCSSQPLVIPDAATQGKIAVQWSGWADSPSGIHSYHFEVFHLQPSGAGAESELIYGQKVSDAMISPVLSDVSQTTANLPSSGPYAFIMSTYDKAGNHRSARRLIVYDEHPTVSIQGTKTIKADVKGTCTWGTYPSPPLVTNADPNANCDWITTKTSSVFVAWRERYINLEHHAGKWLNPVQVVDAIEAEFDDNDGKRTTRKVDNVLGIIAFQVAYNVTFEKQTMQYDLTEVENIYTESFTFAETVSDGMRLDIQIRAIDITGGFAEDVIKVKVDMSPPVIEELWLTRGDRKSISVHNLEDLTKLQIEWKAYDIHSGMNEMKWRIFNNFTGIDIDHGTAYLSPQGDAQNVDECTSLYGDYPRGADCYCTPDDGCFHQHFQVKPKIHTSGTNGLHEAKHLGTHDSDYYIEVTATNIAMLKTTKNIKITIDVSPPVAGSVYEGVVDDFEVDFQQDKLIKVHWKDFFDRESGILFYRYGYGAECMSPEEFHIETGKDLIETYTTKASFEVDQEGKYYVTVAAYNHALDHSIPVCSDGIIVDTAVPIVTEFKVDGALVDPRIFRSTDGKLWFLHEDRTVQEVENPSEACRLAANPITTQQLQLIPLRRNHRGVADSIKFGDSDDCRKYTVDSENILIVLHDRKHIYLSWNVNETNSGVYDFYVGISSTKSKLPDLMDFKSSDHHTHLAISHPNLNEGALFYIIVKSLSRSSVENVQSIGPILLLTTPPTFNGEIVVKAHHEEGQVFFIASWDESSFGDVYEMIKLDYQFAVGTRIYGTDVHPFSDLNFVSTCKSSLPPTCTAISTNELDWDLNHGKEHYITIRVNNTAGLMTRVSSKPYRYDILAPSAGIVIDIDPEALQGLKDNDDIDYQKSRTSMSGRWYGFEHFYSPIHYTACITDEAGVVLQGTCKYVGAEKNTTLNRAQLQLFEKYRMLVIAETDSTSVNASSDGVTIIDPKNNLVNIKVHDGKLCPGEAVELEKEQTHYDQDVMQLCFNDSTHQASVHRLTAYWQIPDQWKPFTQDLFWQIEERAPLVDYWTSKTEEVHTSTSSGEIIVNFPLNPGRSYRFGLKFCAADICYNTLYTNGVTVIPNPPKTGHIDISYSTESKKIEGIFERFYDFDIEELTEAQDVMDFYEWNIADDDAKSRVAKNWTRLESILNVNKTHIQFAVDLENEIQFTKCWNLLLRGTNKAGLYSVLATNIRPCHDPEVVRAATVIDCVASLHKDDIGVDVPTVFNGDPVVLGVNEDWAEEDMDYTPYTNVISAVWPKLRYKIYDWAVLEIHNNDPVLYYSDNPALRNPCDSPDTISCHTTDKNYVNVHFDTEPLNNGYRYAVCIHAEAMVLEHEYWKEHLPEISICSDGITVDTTPPSPGNVWLYHKEAVYQSSNSEVTVYWEKFIDIEELGNHVHASGISHYMVALGSHFGGVDIVSLTNVGICSHYTFHNLKLQDGHSYFATVVGYDFVGRHSNRTSTALVIDTTPPVKSDKGITIGKRFITEQSNIEACWADVFSDPDSGMASYKWGIGSQPGYDDKYSFTETVSTCSQTAEGHFVRLDEGHSYFVTVLGFNNAGLFSTATSWAYTIDTSPPVTGYVNDGERKSGDPMSDLDYQTKSSVLFAHWGGFSDPHTAVKEYIVSVGTTKGGQDAVDTQAVGLVTDIEIKHVQLRDGMTYFVSVTACNVADLCTTATSDGILVDSSPPVPGRVIDGTGNKDIRYQASRSFIGAKWFGFTDPQSGLSHFTWRVGTAALADDIVPAREVHLNEIAVIPDLMRALNKQLPTGKMIYNTIRAYSKGGLFSEASSNGFMVDDTSPTFTLPLSHVPIGSLLPSTSVLRSSLKVKWSVEDSDSFISRQYLSIASHSGEDFNTSLKFGGFIRDYTFTKLQFHDGSLYNVKLIACNGAKLCVSSALSNLLIDSSPPVAGSFAINTDHAVSHKLDRQPDGWMLWENSKIHLAWLGFSDIHSGILEYQINIGSAYLASDLNEDQNRPYVVPSQSTEGEDGFVQTRTIDTQALNDYEHVFISMWAVNGVGLKSEIIHSQFRLIPGGNMQLVRRCYSHTCQGHCVCAARDVKCSIDSEVGSCVNKTGDTTYSVVEVQDVISLTDNLDDSLAGTHIPTDMMLSAKWSYKNGATPLWYEWSVGETDYNTPLGIFESQDRVWRDAGPLLSWTFTMPKGSYLLEGERYSFFVRAWFDENTFSDFKSQGVIIQISVPETTNLFGKAVKEVRNNSPNDIDFVRPDESLFASWDGKFKNADTSISRYRIFISSEPNGHDTYVSEEDVAPQTTRYNLTGIYKEPNTRFYTNIIAYNTAGLATVVSSDGCQIDKETPIAGIVFDGLGYREKSFQNTTRFVSASWQGFVDLGSSLRSYQWCISPADVVGSCTVLPSENVGLVTRAERKLLSPVTNGIKLVNEIFATDQVGHKSTTALSNGVIVDETPPMRLHHVFYGENLLMNPSFENTSSAVSLAYLKMNTCRFDNQTDWVVSDDGCSTVVTAAADMVEDGITFLTLKGSISQIVSQLNIQSLYRLRFSTSHLPLDSATRSNNEGFVEFDGNKHLFMLYSKPQRSDNKSVKLSWHLHTFVFKPRSDEILIKIGSYDNTVGLAIDNIQLQESFTKDDDAREAEGHIEVHTVFQHDWSSVHASWNFYDGESGVKEYLWAIGTVQGGIQLQDFKSVGERTFASNSDLFLPHNATIYVTVVAVNGAGIRAVSYSDPVRVDLTPPIFQYVNDGTVEGKNLVYQDSWHIGVNYKIADPESEISSCSWGIGIQPGDVSLRPFEVIAPGLNSAEDNMERNDNFKTFFVTVRCTNKAGLQATMSSDGVTILENKPTSHVLAVELLGQSPSQYIAQTHYHGTQDQLRIRLTGFGEDQLIAKYKIAIKGPRCDITLYVHDYGPGYIYAKVSGPTFEDGLYNVTVVGINRLDVESDPVNTQVTVLTVPPKVKADIKMEWSRSLEEVTVSWSDVFQSDSPLYYEVSAGSVRGSGDILQWQETSSTELVFTLKQEEIGLYGKTIYAIVRAITLSGTYSTAEKDQLITLAD